MGGNKKQMEKLRYKPKVLETALKHCTEKEQCKGCPMLHVKNEYCGHVLNIEVLKYIEILKELNKTFAQELERREKGEAKAQC